MNDDIKAAVKLLRKAGWTVDPPEPSAAVHPTEVKIKVGKVQPPNLTPAEIHASFRLGG